MRKKIGIVGFPIMGGFGVPESYMSFFTQFGDVEIISHTELDVREHIDLLVLPGGPDVDTSRYLEENDKLHLKVGKPCPFRERFDDILLNKYIDNRTPIFGICRGHQSLAVQFGGKLLQHMSHENNPSDDRTKLVHETLIDMSNTKDFYPFSKGKEIVHDLGPSDNIIISTNSIHHQVVSEVGEFGKIVATYNTDKKTKNKSHFNHIEAISYTDHYPAITVQWHPKLLGL